MVRIQPERLHGSSVRRWLSHGLLLKLAGHLSSLLLLVLLSPLSVLAQTDEATPESDSPGSSAPATPPVSQTCAPNSSPLYPQFVSTLVQTTTWLGDLPFNAKTLLTTVGPQLATYFKPGPWPSLNERAKQSRVPILMYHDILPEKQVFFDVTPAELEQHFKLIRENGLTPITLDQLVLHLRHGAPLPEKPILLTFDDGYKGHYTYVYPLLKQYGYPATFSIYTKKIGATAGRPGITLEDLKQMAADPLVTIAAHTLSHPDNLTKLTDEQLRAEVIESKRILEQELGLPMPYFTYPAGFYDQRVMQVVTEAGYQAALTMDDANEGFAGQSDSLLAIKRFGQSRAAEVIPQAWGGPKLPNWLSGGAFDFSAPVAVNNTTLDNIPLTLISGGRPTTIHANSRYQVPEILAKTEAIAAVDGGFFSLEFLDSNVMIGPVFSHNTNQFIPGKPAELKKIGGRPLVLIGPRAVKYVPFDAAKHNTLEGIQVEMPDVTDAFVAAAWLVRDGQPQPAASFGDLFDFDAERHRAFWGINQGGQPTIGVSHEPVGSVHLGELLAKAGLRDAVMLDSGASTSLAYKGESLVGYTPRPVPHVVALMPSDSVVSSSCVIANR